MYPAFLSTKDKSLSWRLWHSINYMFGGIFFFFGSLMYFPSINKQFNGDLVGGWLFTIGSTNFLLADLTEFNHFRKGFIGALEPHHLSVNYPVSRFRKTELGINFLGSVLGSLLYLIGSICFIPATNLLTLGEWTFIVGSAIIFLSQTWKCFRTLCVDETNPEDNAFKLSNVWWDFSGFNVDLHAGLGGLMYFFGTWFFMGIKNESDKTFAAAWFISGGTFFSLSGIAMQYRYYCTQKVKDQEKEDYENMLMGN
jgi:hypothetical protein